MTVTTDAIRAFAANHAMSYEDNKVALAGGAQSSAPRLLAECTRFTRVATAADSCQLPNLSSFENQGASRLVVNDSPNAIAVFPSAGETINALAANASLSIPAGQSGLFIAPAPGTSGGATAQLTNWRAAVLP